MLQCSRIQASSCFLFYLYFLSLFLENLIQAQGINLYLPRNHSNYQTHVINSLFVISPCCCLIGSFTFWIPNRNASSAPQLQNLLCSYNHTSIHPVAQTPNLEVIHDSTLSTTSPRSSSNPPGSPIEVDSKIFTKSDHLSPFFPMLLFQLIHLTLSELP